MILNGLIFNEKNVIAMKRVKNSENLDIIYLDFITREYPLSIYIWKDDTDIKDINVKYEHLKNIIEKEDKDAMV